MLVCKILRLNIHLFTDQIMICCAFTDLSLLHYVQRITICLAVITAILYLAEHILWIPTNSKLHHRPG
jgi:hypothetical protein